MEFLNRVVFGKDESLSNTEESSREEESFHELIEREENMKWKEKYEEVSEKLIAIKKKNKDSEERYENAGGH